jgi:hypothetical protein
VKAVDDVQMCPFCHSLNHTSIDDCPNIDPEQWFIEHRRLDPHCSCNDCIAYLQNYDGPPDGDAWSGGFADNH